jgi:hypothetical protein
MRKSRGVKRKSISYPISGATCWSGVLIGLAAHGELCQRVARSAHVSEFERALLAEIIEATSNHDLGFTR